MWLGEEVYDFVGGKKDQRQKTKGKRQGVKS
jgi:hypothetical protein